MTSTIHEKHKNQKTDISTTTVLTLQPPTPTDNRPKGLHPANPTPSNLSLL